MAKKKKSEECYSLILLIEDDHGKIRRFDTECGEWRVVRVNMDDEMELEDAAFRNSIDDDFVLEETSETFCLPVLKATPIENDDEEDDDDHN